MVYSERVTDKINTEKHRKDERRVLWEEVSESIEAEGADGVVNQLSGRIADVKDKFDAALSKLEEML